jgi:hypothetical protein
VQREYRKYGGGYGGLQQNFVVGDDDENDDMALRS